MTGTVLRVMEEKGFGFIRGEDNKEYFFHRSDLHSTFEELAADIRQGSNILVAFDPVASDRGPRAGHVMRVDA